MFEAWSMCLRTGGRCIDLTEVNPTRLGLLPVLTEALATLARDASDPLGTPEHRVATDEAQLSCSLQSYEPEPLGSRRARAFLGAHFGVAPSHLMLTASTSEAYAMLFKLLGDAGDEILVPAPSYPLFDFLATFEGLKAIPYGLMRDQAWEIDLGSVDAAITEKTRAIVAVSPNNPTGNYLSQYGFEALLERNLPLIVDEVFEAYNLAPEPASCTISHDSSVQHAAPRTASSGLVFSLGGLSKECLLPQWKLAWTHVAGSDALRREALSRLELLGDTFLSPSVAVQHALPELFAAGAKIRDQALARIRHNLAVARALTKDSAVSVLEPEGGVYLVLRVPSTESDEEWGLRLLKPRAGSGVAVHVHPGSFFGFTGGAYLVLSLLLRSEEFAEGLQLLVHTVDHDART
jgi:alanine-synthesizing transaminase